MFFYAAQTDCAKTSPWPKSGCNLASLGLFRLFYSLRLHWYCGATEVYQKKEYWYSPFLTVRIFFPVCWSQILPLFTVPKELINVNFSLLLICLNNYNVKRLLIYMYHLVNLPNPLRFPDKVDGDQRFISLRESLITKLRPNWSRTINFIYLFFLNNLPDCKYIKVSYYLRDL